MADLEDDLRDTNRDVESLKERLNRIDRYDDIADWRRSLERISYRALEARSESARVKVFEEMTTLIGRMR